MPRRPAARGRTSPFKRLLVATGILAAVVFAVQGGEYGTRDLMRQRARKAAYTRAIDSLQRAVDSLKRYKRRIETDPVLQERIAREEFGLVRGDKELLYRLADPVVDSATPRR